MSSFQLKDQHATSTARSQKRKRRNTSPTTKHKTTIRRRSQSDFAPSTSAPDITDLRAPLSEIGDSIETQRDILPLRVPISSARRVLALGAAGRTIRQHVGEGCGPLPPFSWADSDGLWEYVLSKETVYRKDEFYLKRNHPRLASRMRTILFDWLIEVCEVFQMRRETFYLAVEYCDRFLARTQAYTDSQLQLIGVTCLFIASKVEEIYPPKLADFAYVTDGACTEKQIREMELLQLQALNWMLNPITPISWLSVFLQLANLKSMKSPSENFLISVYSQQDFVKAAQLLDLCMMDIGSLQFSNSVLAASSMCLMLKDDFSWETTGQSWQKVCDCVQWMRPFYLVICHEDIPSKLQRIDKVEKDQRHVVQTHFNLFKLLDDVKVARQDGGCLVQAKPLTPPSSAEKQVPR